jgi:nucleotide-binding universal stress UspA family protein
VPKKSGIEEGVKIMSIKRILVPLAGSGDKAREIDIGVSAAKALGAHIEALFISKPPPAPGRVTATQMAAYARAAGVAPQNSYAEERDKSAQEAYERFAQACSTAGIPMSDEGDTPLAASWRQAEGLYVEVAVRRAAAFDLMVAASANVMEALKDIAEQSLLHARRPVLLAPVQVLSDLTGSVMIAWDESPECWHAVSAAIPFLQLAKTVTVVSVDRDINGRKSSQAEVLGYLRCHGIQATAEVVAPDLRSVGDTLLATASDHDVGLVVMGAYSHSRLREMLLGGPTRHILKHAAARPVLLAH